MLAERFFEKFGLWAIFLGRLLPVIRTYISFPAGVSKIKVAPFCLATIANTVPWNFELAYAGYKLGQHYEEIGRYLGPLTIPLIVVVLILLGLAYWFGRRIGEEEGEMEGRSPEPAAPAS